MWVRSEYAGELAVLLTWLCGLAPWAVTWISGEDASGFFLWFHPGNFLFTPGLDLPGERPFWVWEFLDFPVYNGETYVSILWLAGWLLFLVAIVLSVVYYFREQQVESLPLDPVRTLGALLLGSGLLLGGAFVLLFQHHLGTTVPVGVCFHLLFGAILLKTERVERGQ